MPWFAWIAIVAIIVFGITQIIGLATGRSLSKGADAEEIEQLKKRIEELESSPQEIEGQIPTKGEENMAAEDRWRLDMLEARLEELEKKPKNRDDDAENE